MSPDPVPPTERTAGRAEDRYSLAPYRPIALDDLVRLGRANDGGYVISRRCIPLTRQLLAFGISFDWSFEQDFVARNSGVRVVGVDGTVSTRVFARAAWRSLKSAMLGVSRADLPAVRRSVREAGGALWMAREFARFFHRPGNRFVNAFLVGESVAMAEPSLSWRRLYPRVARPAATSQPDLFIKMDIEGAEYAVLPDLLADAPRATGMAIEFHDLDARWGDFTDVMARLDEHFAVAHVHGNNFRPPIAGSTTPSVLEISLVNRKLLSAPAAPSLAGYPLPDLDMPNDATKPDFSLDLQPGNPPRNPGP